MSRKVRIDDLFRLTLPGSPALSPCGSRIAFTVKRLDKNENRYTSHLWIVPAKGGRPRQLTHGLVSDGSPAWSPDGSELAFVSDRDEKSQVWILPLGGGEPRQVTKLGGGPVSSISWSPNGREIVFNHVSVPKISDDEKKKKAAFKHITHLNHKEDGFGWFANEFWTIWKVNASSGRATAMTSGDHHDSDPRWSPDGKRIAFSSGREEDRRVYPDQTGVFVMNANGKSVREITSGRGGRDTPRWSVDGNHIYWVGYQGGPGEWIRHEHSLWRARADGKGDATILNPGHDRWVMNMVGSDTNLGSGGVMEAYRDGDEERVLFGSDEDGSYRLYSVSGAGGDVRLELGGKLSALGACVGGGTGGVAACVIGTKSDTGEVFRISLDGSEVSRQLTKLTSSFFGPLDCNEPEEFRFKNGKTNLQGWVLKPPGFRKGRKYPCLIEVHGGPMTQYGETWFHEMQVLAAQGWVVAYCNPRGSSGQGKKFCNCIEGKWGKDDWSDVQALTNYMARKPYVASRRIGILGGSYGGFMATWAIGHTNRYAAAVTQRQAGDYHVMYGSSDFGHYDTFLMSGKPWEQPMKYHRASPNFYVENMKTPVLIVHSENDLRCPIGNAESLFTALKVLDKAPCEMVRFESEFHGLSRNGKPRNREERLKRIVDWFERFL